MEHGQRPGHIMDSRQDRRPVSRWVYAGGCCLVIPLGLATRQWPEFWPEWIARYGGDTLWTLNLYLVLRWLRPVTSLPVSAAWCYALSLAVECSQLFHPPWLDALRRPWLGRIILGEGFLASDLVCYAVGTALGLALDMALRLGVFRPGTSE
jgi:hypothetical protein